MKEISKNISKILSVTLPLITILAVITPFVLVENSFFPYITAKAFYFRILVEVMILLYILHIYVDKSVRPKMSPVAVAVTIFTLVLGIATIFAVDPLKSFWSNYERMEGFILFIHLFAYFFIAGSVLRVNKIWWKNWWHWFFIASLVMSVIVGVQAFSSLYGDIERNTSRIYGKLGNSTYLGVYSMIHVFIALFFIIQRIARRAVRALTPESWIMIAVYALLGLFNMFVLYHTGTRGSFVGLVGGVMLASLLIAIFEKKDKLLRKIAIVIIGLSVISVTMLGLARNTDFVKSSNLLNRFAELITLDFKSIFENQGKSRAILWGISWDGVKERPIAGWGLDNFHFIFAKHYDPAAANQEQWFDRSHNVLMDWLTQAGFLGLLSYLALFYGALHVLWRRRMSGVHDNVADAVLAENENIGAGMTRSEKAVLTGAFAGYFAHNIFVFDNLSSYVMFFSILAFLHQTAISRKVEAIEEGSDAQRYRQSGGMVFAALATVALVGFIIMLYAWNIKPIMANAALITSMRGQIADPKTGQPVDVPIKLRFESLQRSIAYGTMTNSEQYEQLSDRGVEFMSSTEPDIAKNAVHTYIVEQYEKALKRTPNDPRPFFFYALYLSRINLMSEAQLVASKMVAISPEKPTFLTFLASIELQLGNKEAFTTLSKKAYALNPADAEAVNLYRIGLIRTGQAKDAEATATTTQQMTDYLTNWNIVSAYLEQKQGVQAIALIRKQIPLDPMALNLRSALASVYVQLGNPLAAIKELEEIKKLAPEYSANIDEAIQQIKTEAKLK